VRRRYCKKKLNRWHIQREAISHQSFHHSFYALLARPKAARALEHLHEPWPESISLALHKWDAVRRELLSLLESANPGAIVACDLHLALLQVQHPASRAVIERYRLYYSSRIELYTHPVFLSVSEIDREVHRLLNAVIRKAPETDRDRSTILELCARLSEQLHALRSLADLGELND
jgi:hypothetical protein